MDEKVEMAHGLSAAAAKRFHLSRLVLVFFGASVGNEEIDNEAPPVSIPRADEWIGCVRKLVEALINLPQHVQYWRHAIADVFGNAPKLRKVNVLCLERSSSQLYSKRTRIGLKRDRPNQNASETKEYAYG